MQQKNMIIGACMPDGRHSLVSLIPKLHSYGPGMKLVISW